MLSLLLDVGHKDIKNINQQDNEKRQQKQRIHSSRVEIFRWLLRNGMNKMDIDGLKDLTQHYQRLSRPKGPPAGPSTLKGSKQAYSIYSSLETFKKPKAKFIMRNLTTNRCDSC